MTLRVQSEAEARRYAQAAGVRFPKPVSVLKRYKPLKRTALKRSGKPIKRTKRPSAMSAIRKARIAGWPKFREAIFTAHGGICYWCGKHCPLEDGTAEHIVPYARTHLDVETLCAWIHHKGFPMSCHGVKSGSGFGGQVAGLRWNARLYGVAEGRPTPEPGEPMREYQRELRDILWRGLNRAQSEIGAGRRPSLLEKR